MTIQPLNDGRYDSVAEFMSATRGECHVASNQAERDDLLNNAPNGGAWYGPGIEDGAHVQRLMREGWPDGQMRVADLLSKIDASQLVPIDRRRRLRRADMGDHLDIHAVYAGRFQSAWSVARRTNTIGPQRVDILANMICSGGESAEVLFWRGAAAVALSDALESAGYMVRLVVGFGDMPRGGDGVSCRITVKDYDKPMDIATAAAVTLPGFFRGMGHAWIMGHDVGARSSCSIHVGECIKETGEIFLSHEVRDEASAMRWAIATIARINGQEGDSDAAQNAAEEIERHRARVEALMAAMRNRPYKARRRRRRY